MPPQFRRKDLKRWGPPVAFLAAATILIVLIHSALSGGRGQTTTRQIVETSAPTVTTAPTTTRPKPPGKRFYSIQSGDTLGSVASRFGTTVERLLQLNPGVDPTSLTIGEKIRIR